MPGIIAAFPAAVVVIYPPAPLDQVAGGHQVNIRVGHVLREATIQQVELGVAVIAAQFEIVVAFKAAIVQNRFRFFVPAPVVPDGRVPIAADERTVLGQGPATRAVEIHPAFHDTILEVEHAAIGIPGTHRIAAPGPEDAVLYHEPCGGE